jgi:protein-disulfide isomerase
MTRTNMTCAIGLLWCVLALPLVAETVAVVNGERITRAEVDESIAARLAALEQQAYALRRGSLDNLITTALLRAEAKKEGISVEELRKRLSSATVQVTRADVEKEYAARPGAFDSLSTDEALERVRLDLESRARLTAYRDATAKLRASASIEVRLDAPRVDPGNPDVDGAPFRGPRDARIVITEFADYECPYCRSSQPALDRLLEAYGDEVRLVFRQFPLESHPQALAAAKASVCAAKQGRFWEVHDALFAAPSLAEDVLRRAASSAGLDVPAFDACRASDATLAAVMKDRQTGKRIGVTGTPTYVVNGVVLSGAVGFEQLQSAVIDELKKAAPARASMQQKDGKP